MKVNKTAWVILALTVASVLSIFFVPPEKRGNLLGVAIFCAFICILYWRRALHRKSRNPKASSVSKDRKSA